MQRSFKQKKLEIEKLGRIYEVFLLETTLLNLELIFLQLY